MVSCRNSLAVTSFASSSPRSETMRARSTSSPASISASSKACRLAISSDARLRSREMRTSSSARSCATRSASVCICVTISPRLRAASARVTSSAFSASAIWRSRSTISSARLASISSRVCARSRSIRADCNASSSAICSRSVCSRVLSSTSSSARRRAISSDCVSRSVRMRSSASANSCAMRDFSTASRAASCACSASWSRIARSRVRSARWLARRISTSRSCSSRAYSPSRSISSTRRWVSRFWLRMSTSVCCSISLRILRRVSMDWVRAVRPSASKAFEGSKNSRLVWSRSTMATDSSSSPFAARDSIASSRTRAA